MWNFKLREGSFPCVLCMHGPVKTQQFFYVHLGTKNIRCVYSWVDAFNIWIDVWRWNEVDIVELTCLFHCYCMNLHISMSSRTETLHFSICKLCIKYMMLFENLYCSRMRRECMVDCSWLSGWILTKLVLILLLAL